MVKDLMHGRQVDEFYAFIASPGDVDAERASVRAYFRDFNRTVGQVLGVSFQVIDWENFSTAGIGRPQELITKQTLERFRANLALVIVVMAQRFGSPTGVSESGTEEEVRWALTANAQFGFPEIKFFFREIKQFVAPPDPHQILHAADQWERVCRFRREIQDNHLALCKTYADAHSFESVLRGDLDRWLTAPDRPWARTHAEVPAEPHRDDGPPAQFSQHLFDAYRWLDIAGIDSDRAFKLPLSKIYVRLRVISSEGSEDEREEDSAAISIQNALERYRRLAIVGDPGSGKSTFLRFIALTIAQCALDGDTQAAVDELSLLPPLPIPLYISCWELSEYLRQRPRARTDDIVEFAAKWATAAGWYIGRADLERALDRHQCLLLIDGLDEVPTEDGRHFISTLVEEFVRKYPENRYVVTSRVRAYTGGTVLGENFTRSDIQPFGDGERHEFLRNWVNQLFEVRTETDPGGTAAAAELTALSEAIDTSSIKSLATNPLLLTVIAIVHWNRKRLPEQRVDLYDECIDVLLGQRKQAEQQRSSRDTRILSEEYSEERLDQRSWIRKRFADIAFAILDKSDEEIGRGAAVELLAPYFASSGNVTPSQKAERFLDRHELTSGLLVRRSGAYRFAHLTFQEYLAAWHLANRDLSDTLGIIGSHLRDPKWFETLQLLGGELANKSDEYLNRYIAFMLDRSGETIRQRAPVIALTANVVRDTQTAAGLRGETLAQYENLVRGTLDAFKPENRVQKEIQLDLLEALGSIGASAKEQIIAATDSGLLAVRRRALQILVPHLPDDDLFAMSHVLADRSKEPIKTYMKAIMERDPIRASRLLLEVGHYGDRTVDALHDFLPLGISPRLPAPRSVNDLATWPILAWRFLTAYDWAGMVRLLDGWADDREETRMLLVRLALANKASEKSRAVIALLARRWSARADTWELIRSLARDGNAEAISTLARRQRDRADTWELIRSLAREGSATAITSLAYWAPEGQGAWELIKSLARDGNAEAISALIEWRDDEETSELIRCLDEEAIRALAAKDSGTVTVRLRASGYPAHRSLELIKTLARMGSSESISTLAIWQRDREDTWELIGSLAREGSATAITSLANWAPGREGAWELIRGLARDGNAEAISVLASRQGDREDTWELMRSLAREGSATAITSLAIWRPDREDTWELIRALAQEGSVPAVQSLAQWGHNRAGSWEFIRTLDDEVIERIDWTDSPMAAGALWRLNDGDRERKWIRIAAEQGSSIAIVTLSSRWPFRSDTWELIATLARRGNGQAISDLARLRSDRNETWDLIRTLAQEGSTHAAWTLIQWGATRDDTWALLVDLNEEAIARIAQGLMVPQLRTIARQHGHRPGAWKFLERLAKAGVAEADSLLAWRTWAVATAGPEVLEKIGGRDRAS